MSKADSKAAAGAPAVEEVEEDDVPELEEIKPDDVADSGVPIAGKQSRSQRRYNKVMAKMGFKPENGINRVTIRKAKNIMFAISAPEAYRYPATDCYVLFGEAIIDDSNQDTQKSTARAFTQGNEAAAAAPAAAADDDNEEVSAEGIEEKDIELVMTQAVVTRPKAIKALRANGNDIVNAIMALTA